MCEPVTAAMAAMTTMEMVMVGATVVSTAASIYGQHESAVAQVKALNAQNEQQAQQIADEAGQVMFERARAARRERGMMRANGAEAGINLGSGSFLAAFQTSAFNQYNDQGLVLHNEKNQQAARAVNARSAMSSIQMPTALGAAFQIGTAGAGAYYGAKGASSAGAQHVTGGPTYGPGGFN